MEVNSRCRGRGGKRIAARGGSAVMESTLPFGLRLTEIDGRVLLGRDGAPLAEEPRAQHRHGGGTLTSCVGRRIAVRHFDEGIEQWPVGRDAVAEQDNASLRVHPVQLRGKIRDGEGALVLQGHEPVIAETIEPVVNLLASRVQHRTDQAARFREVAGECGQRRHLDDGLSERESEPLGGGGSDPEPGEGAGTGGHRDGVDRGKIQLHHPRDGVQHRKQRLAVRFFVIDGIFCAKQIILQYGDACHKAGGVERDQFHGIPFR